MKESSFAKSKVLSSLLWKIMERSGTQGVQFMIQIILARLLSPEQFGTIAIVMVFIHIAQAFLQSGFSTALIQKKNADEIDFSSVFHLSILVVFVLYTILFFLAPTIASFYNDITLIPILRVLSLTLFFGAFNSIQNAFIARNFLFKKLFISSLGATLISGVLGIIAAYNGLGVWALVLQQLANQIATSIIIWINIEWSPKLVFSISRVKVLFSYGWKLLVASLLNVIYMDLRTLIIGRLFSPAMLGYFNRGELFPKLIVTNIDGSIQSVMLPTLSAQQDDKKRMKEMMRRAIVSSSFLIFPMMVGMAVIAESLVKIVLTDKWLPAVPFLQIACLTYSLWPIHTANLQAINAMGRSDTFLKLEIIKKILGIIILLISIPLGVYAIALGSVLNSIVSTFINALPNKQLLDYSYKEQWLDILPSLFVSIVMGLIIYTFKVFKMTAIQTIIMQVSVGAILYVVMAKIFRMESYSYLVGTLKQLIKSRKTNFSK